jgi:tape measure domain-containing protein
MGDSTEWGISLRDEMSGPARSAASALRGMQDDLKGVAYAAASATSATDAVAKSIASATKAASAISMRKQYRQETLRARARESVSFGGGEESTLADQRRGYMAWRAVAARAATSAFTGYQTTQISRTRRMLSALGDVAFGTWRKLGGGDGGARSAAGALEETGRQAERAGGFFHRAFEFATGTLIERGIEKVAHLAKEITFSTVEAASFGQTSRGAFTALARYGASGDKLFQHSMDMAEKLGLDIHDTTHAYQGLLAAQFNPEQADAVVKLGSDLRTIGASSDQVRLALANMEQVWAKGKADMMDFRQFASYGISEKLIFEEIAKKLKISVEQVPKAISDSKVKSGTAMASIIDAVKHKLHENNLGEATEKWANTTMAGLWGQLKAGVQRVNVELGDAIAPELTSALRGMLDDFKSFATSKEGIQFFKDLALSVKDLAKALVEALPSLKKMLDVATFLVGPVKHDLPAQQERTKGGVGEGGELSVDRIREINQKYRTSFDPMGWIFEAMGLKSESSSAKDAARSRGAQIANAAADGIVLASQARDPDLFTCGADMGKAMMSGVQTELQVHSPSRAMAWVGTQGGVGLGLGFAGTARANVGIARGVAADMVDASRIDTVSGFSGGAFDTSIPARGFQPQVQQISMAASAPQAAGGGTGPISVNIVQNFHGQADEQAVEQASKRGAMAGLHALLDQLSLEAT